MHMKQYRKKKEGRERRKRKKGAREGRRGKREKEKGQREEGRRDMVTKKQKVIVIANLARKKSDSINIKLERKISKMKHTKRL